MRVDVRLYASLADRRALMEEGVELPANGTLADLIASLNLDEKDVHLVIVDGRIVHDRTTAIRDGARVALFPPVGGG